MVSQTERQLNYYRLKPVGWKINRKLRTEVLRLRLRNSKTVTAVTRLGAVLTADVLGGCPNNALPVLATYMGHSSYMYTIKYLKVIDAQQRLGLVNFIGTHSDQP